MQLPCRFASMLPVCAAFAFIHVVTAETQVGPAPSADAILAKVRKGHPRLLATEADFDRLKAGVATNATLKSWHAKLQQHGDKLLSEPPSKYEIPDGLRLLATSRRVLDRVQTLALLYRLDGKPQYADRAWLELNTAAAFTNWNPKHFLDTAEMTRAFAIGYDWLYDYWTPDQRRVLREAMIEKGLKLANGIQSRSTWWKQSRHNWNQVCNGGIGMGALALADEEPGECGRFLESAIKSIQFPMAEFAPDGAWGEGPGYWDYATSYNCVFLAALDSALGTDFGLSQMPGFSETGLFPIYASGPTGKSFNYADSHSDVIRAPQLFWLARKFNQPAFAVYERNHASPDPLDIVWYDPRGEGAMPKNLALDKYFRHAEVVMLRSKWNDPNALWVGFKAGDNKANHGHLDLGSFVLEALGERWAEDLGADNYNMPGYFGKQRWTYYRLRAEGHNTLVIDAGGEPDQDPGAVASIIQFQSETDTPFAIADLTAAYQPHATRVERGISMPERRRVLVQDEITAESPADVWWFLHTEAAVETHGTTATLTRNGRQLVASILSPAGAEFTVMEARPLPTSPAPEVQNQNRGLRKLAIHLEGVKTGRIAVLLSPGDSSKPVPVLHPLADWGMK